MNCESWEFNIPPYNINNTECLRQHIIIIFQVSAPSCCPFLYGYQICHVPGKPSLGSCPHEFCSPNLYILAGWAKPFPILLDPLHRVLHRHLVVQSSWCPSSYSASCSHHHHLCVQHVLVKIWSELNTKILVSCGNYEMHCSYTNHNNYTDNWRLKCWLLILTYSHLFLVVVDLMG